MPVNPSGHKAASEYHKRQADRGLSRVSNPVIRLWLTFYTTRGDTTMENEHDFDYYDACAITYGVIA